MSGRRQRGGAKLNRKKKNQKCCPTTKKKRWTCWIMRWMWLVCLIFFFFFQLERSDGNSRVDAPVKHLVSLLTVSLLVNFIYSKVWWRPVTAAPRPLKQHNHWWFTRLFTVRLCLKKKEFTGCCFFFPSVNNRCSWKYSRGLFPAAKKIWKTHCRPCQWLPTTFSFHNINLGLNS